MCDINRFYICEFCGNVIGMIHYAGVPVMCCGEEMTKLEPSATDGSQEKHGDSFHEMTPFVSLSADIIKNRSPTRKPGGGIFFGLFAGQ